MDDTRAVFWMSSEDKYTAEAAASSNSFRKHMSDITTILACPYDPGHNYVRQFDELIVLPPPPHQSWWTNSVYYFSYVNKVLFDWGITEALYLDTDTHVCAPVYDLFRIVGYGDYVIAGAHAPGRITSKSEHDIPDCFPEINIGVNVMNTSSARELWTRAYQCATDNPDLNDQGALREALWMHPEFTAYILPPEYNMRLFPCFVSREVKILHGRSDEDYQSICNKINASKGMRLWYKNQVLGE